MQQWARQPIFWSIVMVLMGFSFLSPLQIITMHFAMVPIVMIVASTRTLSSFALYFGVPTVLLLFLSGAAWPLVAVIIAVMLVPGAAIGYMYKRQSGAIGVLTAGVVGMIAVLLAILASLTLGGINIQAEIKAVMQEQFDLFARLTGSAVLTEEALDSFISVAVQLLPLYIIMIGFYYSVVTHVVSRRLLGKLGFPASALPPVHEWRLPRSLIWYYLIVLILDFVTPADGALAVFILNVYPILLFTFAVQGLAFFFYWAYIKGRGRILPVLAIVLCLFFPPAMYITSMVGLFDTAFPIRSYLAKK